MGASHRAVIDIVGVGLCPDTDCTLGALSVLRQSTVAITFDPIGTIVPFARKLGIDVENIAYLYPDHKDRPQYYDRVAEHVVSLCQSRPTVCYVTYGHPCMLDQPVENICRLAQERQITCVVHNAPSFIDSILAAEHLFIRGSGLQVYTASHLLERKPAINPDSPLIVGQLLALGSLDDNAMLVTRPADLVPLVKYLATFYSGSEQVVLLSASAGEIPAVARKATFATLPFFAATVTALTSLVVSP